VAAPLGTDSVGLGAVRSGDVTLRDMWQGLRGEPDTQARAE
jgi:hypothetical protein